MFRFISQFRYGKISQTCISIETCITIVNAFKTFQAIQKENQKKKIWVNQGSEFYNSSFKKWFDI